MSSSDPVHKPLKVKLDYVTFRMDVVNELAKSVASTVYEKEVGLSLRDLRLMRFIATRPGLTVTQLVEQTHLEKTLTSKSVADLVRRGLVVRAIGETDARQTNLFVTKEGARRVKAADTVGCQMEARMMSVISESDAEVFRRCLEALYTVHSDTQKIYELYQPPWADDATGRPHFKSAKEQA